MWPGPTASSSSAMPVSAPSMITVSVPGGDFKEPECEKIHSVQFSKSSLRDHMTGYQAGKYTKKYVEVYLEFCCISGFISNLEYLEYKAKLKE